MTFPPGTNAMWIRYWLASGGIHPDKDVNLITIPPPQVVANMKVDKMDGFCVGEPWNARAIADGIGLTAITTQQMWRDHPEKVCAFTEEFAMKNPKTVKAILKALHLSSVWIDKLDNRKHMADVVSQATYINCPPEIILGRLLGKYEYGDGKQEQDPNYMIFSGGECPGSALAASNMAGKQTLHPRAVRQARRDGSRDSAARVLQFGARGQRFSSWCRHRNAARIYAGPVQHFQSNVRSRHSGPAA